MTKNLTIMTKGSEQRPTDDIESSTKMDIGKTLKDVLVRARKERRITCGLYESGLILEMNPDSVMLCVLPINKTDDISLDIHHTLIEAFCLENAISLVKVNGVEDLELILADRPAEKGGTDQESEDNKENMYLDGMSLGDANDFNCVLVEYSADKCTEEEGDVLQYYKEVCDSVPEPIIDLNK